MARPKKEKVTEGKVITTTPVGIGNLSFGDEISQYKQTLQQELALKKDIEALKEQGHALAEEHGMRDSDLSYCARNVEVKKKNPKPTFPEDVELLRNSFASPIRDFLHTLEGSSYNDNDKKAKAMLKNTITRKGMKLLQAVVEARETMSNWKQNETDVEATQQVKEKLKVIIEKVEEKEKELSQLQTQKASFKEYVSMVKDVASIAAVGSKK